MNKSSSVINISLQQRDIDKSAILQMLADNQTKSLYILIAEKPRIASELRYIANIPLTSLYRKLTWLLDKGLIRGMTNKQGGYTKITFYTIISKAIIRFENRQIKIDLELEIEQ